MNAFPAKRWNALDGMSLATVSGKPAASRFADVHDPPDPAARARHRLGAGSPDLVVREWSGIDVVLVLEGMGGNDGVLDREAGALADVRH